MDKRSLSLPSEHHGMIQVFSSIHRRVPEYIRQRGKLTIFADGNSKKGMTVQDITRRVSVFSQLNVLPDSHFDFLISKVKISAFNSEKAQQKASP